MGNTLILRFATILLFLIGIFLGLLLMFGPSEPFTGKISFDESALGDDLDVYLQRTERSAKKIRPGLEKRIIWPAGRANRMSDIALVYLHGFSASSGEIRPVPDIVAETLGAPLYFARLAGHGMDSDALAKVQADDWINDTAEAIAIGSRLGKKLIVISTSTGSSLAAYVHAQKPKWARKIAGHIMMSPNFGLADPTSVLLALPFARHFVPVFIGKERGEKTGNPKIDHIWTIPYATQGLMPLARITHEAAESPLRFIDTPVLVIRSVKDQTVSPAAMTRAISRFSGPVEEVFIENSAHINHHVLAGDAISPGTTDMAIKAILGWISRHF